MINVGEENLMPLGEASRYLKNLTGENRFHPTTLWRWSQHGLRGVKLETVRMGGRKFTSSEALQRFFACLETARRAGGSSYVSDESRARKAKARLQAELSG